MTERKCRNCEGEALSGYQICQTCLDLLRARGAKECGCQIVERYDEVLDPYHIIEYCPTHAAAPETYGALEKILLAPRIYTRMTNREDFVSGDSKMIYYCRDCKAWAYENVLKTEPIIHTLECAIQGGFDALASARGAGGKDG
jgi:hypothetical protein